MFKKYKIDEISINLDNRRKPLNNIERNKISKEKLYPYYGANNLMDYVDEYIFDEEIICIAEDGGSWGKNEKCSYIVNEKCWVNNHAHVLRVKDLVNIKYLYYLLNYNDLNKYITGTTRGKLTKSALNNIEVDLPEKQVQNKIVKILNKAEDLIKKRKEQIEDLDELVKSKFNEMFGDVFLNTKNFEMKQIKDVVTVVKGITYKPEQVDEEGTIVLRSSNIKGNKFDLNDIVRVNKKIDEKFLVEVNDILMCNRNGSERLVGKVAKIPKYSEPMTFGTFMTIVRSPYYNYLFTFFQTEAFRRQIKMQTSVAINQISIPLLQSVKVPLPPIELQNQFADFVKQVDKLKFEMENSLKELEDNFNSLMQKAFKGELFN